MNLISSRKTETTWADGGKCKRQVDRFNRFQVTRLPGLQVDRLQVDSYTGLLIRRWNIKLETMFDKDMK